MRKGFSLLEVLVVMSIIGVLLTVGVASFGSMQKRARDAKRKSDVKAIQSALEQYHSICNNYPDIPESGIAGSKLICDKGMGYPTIVVMTSVPKDPMTAAGYPCIGLCNAVQYKICPVYEGKDSYCITNQQ